MRNFLKNVIAMTLAISFVWAATSCSPEESSVKKEYDASTRVATDVNEVVWTPEEGDYEYYNNYIELYDDEGTVYNVGDPFVMRFDGKYYLYTSVDNSSYKTGKNSGKIPVWVSDNLVDWEWGGFAYEPTGEESPTGASYVAFAPEVIYYKGYFYLCESQRGNGHYFFRSDSPTGPFKRISDNLGMGIDGTFYLHDDGQLYFLSANDSVSRITGCAIDFVEDSVGNVTVQTGELFYVNEAYLGGWTEGPGIIKRNGYSYMTYTGNHVDSSGYLVAYSYSEEEFPLENLQTKSNNVTLVSSGMDEDILVPYGGTNAFSDNFRGTGHSSNVVGPDLDSVYTAFHIANRINYNNQTGDGQRRYCITQYFTNGSYLLTNGLGNYQKTKASAPDYSASASELDLRDGRRMSAEETQAVYTAELSFTLKEGEGEVVAGYTSASDYARISVSGSSLTYSMIRDGKEEMIASGSVSVSTNGTAIHTVKIVNGADRIAIYYDNVLSVTASRPTTEGYVGYGANVQPSSTCFSNDAFGTSDFDAVKDLTGSWAAYSYLKGENLGWQIAGASADPDGVRQGEPETTKEAEGLSARALVLRDDDWVKYLVNAPEAGMYSLNVLLGAESAGCIFEVIVDNQIIYKMEIPENTVFGENGYANVQAGMFECGAGLHTLKIRVFSGTLDAVNFSTEKGAEPLGTVADELTSSESVFRNVIGTNYSFMGGAGLVTSASDKRTLFITGSCGVSDYEFSVDVKAISNSYGGIMFRMNDFNYSDSSKVHFGTRFTGYFLLLNSSYVALYRNDQMKSKELAFGVLPGGISFSGQYAVTVTVRAEGGSITILLNGEETLQIFDEDALLSGYIGLYTEADTSFVFSNYGYNEL